MIRNVSNLFYNPIQTKEDLKKVQMYKAQIQRANKEKQIGNIEDYLKSLDLKIKVYLDDSSHISRISQMTQKTNQFNLTTKRYTEKDIENFMVSENSAVMAIGVEDKFGDNGIVGLVILNLSEKFVTIETLLMSCRVLGRNVEYKFMDIIVDFVKEKNIEKIYSEYLRTIKNTQVEDLFDRYGFESIGKKEKSHQYTLELSEYKTKELNYIKVNNERKG